MTTDLIRWLELAPGHKSILGYAGIHEPWAFQIWTGGDGDRWQLVTQLPGVNVRPESADVDELKAAAEGILREFASSLGALFATDLREHLTKQAAIQQELGDDYSETPGETALEQAHGYWGHAEACRDLIKWLDHELETRNA